MSSKKERLILLAILALSVALRVGVALYLGDSTPAGKDETSYSVLAARLAAGHGYSFDRPWYPFAPADAPTAHWSFLYTAFVAALYALAGPHPLAPRLAGAVLSGILLPLLVYLLTRRAFWGGEEGESGRVGEWENPTHPLSPSPPPPLFPSLPLLAAFLAAIYAYFVLYGAMVQTEALFICAMLWSLERALALAERLQLGLKVRVGDVLWLGVALGVATLLRQSILPWVVVLFAWLLWAGLRAHALRAALLSVLASALILALFILPFTLRNYHVYGSFLLLNSNAGYAMYSAQHPLHGTSFQEYAAAPLPADLAGQGLNEAQWDRELMRRGLGFILAEPGRYLLLSLSRVRDYVEFWPTADSSLLFNLGRILSIGLFLPFMLYGLYLSLRQSRTDTSSSTPLRPLRRRFGVLCNSGTSFLLPPSSFSLLYLFVVVYSLLHILTWAMSRYRLPVDAVLIIFAALGLADLWARVKNRRREDGESQLDVGARGV